MHVTLLLCIQTKIMNRRYDANLSSIQLRTTTLKPYLKFWGLKLPLWIDKKKKNVVSLDGGKPNLPSKSLLSMFLYFLVSIPIRAYAHINK